jgi:hypothetical protein
MPRSWTVILKTRLGGSCGIPQLAKIDGDMGYPLVCGQDRA